jgi:hypothetical protein
VRWQEDKKHSYELKLVIILGILSKITAGSDYKLILLLGNKFFSLHILRLRNNRLQATSQNPKLFVVVLNKHEGETARERMEATGIKFKA